MINILIPMHTNDKHFDPYATTNDKHFDPYEH